ncbi:MAG: hypothetical protein WC683_09695 [bacterium]
MTTCRLCGANSPRAYCSDCTERLYELKRDWAEIIHELTEEVCARARAAFQDLEERETAPVALEVLAEALHAMSLPEYRRLNYQLSRIWGELRGTREDEKSEGLLGK